MDLPTPPLLLVPLTNSDGEDGPSLPLHTTALFFLRGDAALLSGCTATLHTDAAASPFSITPLEPANSLFLPPGAFSLDFSMEAPSCAARFFPPRLDFFLPPPLAADALAVLGSIVVAAHLPLHLPPLPPPQLSGGVLLLPLPLPLALLLLAAGAAATALIWTFCGTCSAAGSAEAENVAVPPPPPPLLELSPAALAAGMRLQRTPEGSFWVKNAMWVRTVRHPSPSSAGCGVDEQAASAEDDAVGSLRLSTRNWAAVQAGYARADRTVAETADVARRLGVLQRIRDMARGLSGGAAAAVPRMRPGAARAAAPSVGAGAGGEALALNVEAEAATTPLQPQPQPLLPPLHMRPAPSASSQPPPLAPPPAPPQCPPPQQQSAARSAPASDAASSLVAAVAIATTASALSPAPPLPMRASDTHTFGSAAPPPPPPPPPMLPAASPACLPTPAPPPSASEVSPLPALDMERHARALRMGVPTGALIAKLRGEGVADPEAVLRALERRASPAAATAVPPPPPPPLPPPPEQLPCASPMRPQPPPPPPATLHAPAPAPPPPQVPPELARFAKMLCVRTLRCASPPLPKPRPNKLTLVPCIPFPFYPYAGKWACLPPQWQAKWRRMELHPLRQRFCSPPPPRRRLPLRPWLPQRAA